MNIGDKEWMEKVEQNLTLPCKLAFLLIKENDGTTGLFSTQVKSTAKIENVKYSHISKSTWTSQGSAVLSVKEITTVQEYLEETLHLMKVWDFAIIKKDKENVS
ncbi:hypothetical protein HF072_07280 [Bacillus sp. RO3]|nr:hypothetical protein [Bacillus sp. RO3]